MMLGLTREAAPLISRILLHGLETSDSGTAERGGNAECSQFSFTQCWIHFKLFILDQAQVNAGDTSLLLHELETAAPEVYLDLSVTDRRKLNEVLVKAEDILIPLMLLKFERYKLLAWQSRYLHEDSDSSEEVERDFVFAMNIISSLCGFQEMKDSYLKDIISTRDDFDDHRKLRLTNLVHIGEKGCERRHELTQNNVAPSNKRGNKTPSVHERSNQYARYSSFEEDNESVLSAKESCLYKSAVSYNTRMKWRCEKAVPNSACESLSECPVPKFSGDECKQIDGKGHCDIQAPEPCEIKQEMQDQKCFAAEVKNNEQPLNGCHSVQRSKTPSSCMENLDADSITITRNRRTVFSCPVYGDKFHSPGTLNIHQQSHNNKDKSSSKCEFKQEGRLKESLRKCSSNHNGAIKTISKSKSKHCSTSISKSSGQSDCGSNGRIKKSGKSKSWNGCKIFCCKVCKKSFLLHSKYKMHLKSHATGKYLKCDICSMSFRGKSKLQRHKLTHTGKKPFDCEICGAFFADRSHLNVHLRTHSGEKPFQCDLCDASFPESTKLKNHMRVHTGEKPFVCEICGSSFSVSSSLKSHMKIHSGQKPYKCDKCDFAAVHPSNLKAHLHVHTGEKRHICDKCGASFSERTKLKRHKMVHTGERPYSCEVCGTRFADKSHLTVHLRIHSGEKPFKCSFCSSAFVESSKLKNHLRTHTGEKPYVCEVCGMSFAVSYSLKSHMRRHTGEKPYKCEICGYATSQSSNLKTHMVVHNGSRPHVCVECGASFSEPSKLNRHKRVHLDFESNDNVHLTVSQDSLKNLPVASGKRQNIVQDNYHQQNHGSGSHCQLQNSSLQEMGTIYDFKTGHGNAQAISPLPHNKCLNEHISSQMLGNPVSYSHSFLSNEQSFSQQDIHLYHSALADNSLGQPAVNGACSVFPNREQTAGNLDRATDSACHFPSLYKDSCITDSSLHLDLSSL